ncbi:endonuclease/exonuclease/phosphatase family protein [Mucilaginibacter segetis]|uniref:Endonuclease/exonuclease/phosphatase family protein n=1 Tax=Mucilaginibacter segetis TaxID=2793071 RepID=A0A934PV76_9SPHI|nr:endonuclease/exonuclease/phosphatase family protein [Mucilaginibacter segetis]MBK0380669.1 endonuclease/exonuclease/phosphatase family protein [Mucilaginibacter segetis]
MRVKKRKKQLLLIDKIFLTLNIIVALALLLSYLAPSTDPRDFWIIAILGFGYHLLIIANLFFILYWLFRKAIFILISAISIFIGFSFIMANYGFRSATLPAENKPAGSIRIMQYNVRKFKGIDRFYESPIQNEISEVVENKNPDIIDFEEFSITKANKDSITNIFKQSIKSNYYYFKIFDNTRYDSTGNAIFSRYPIINTGYVETNGFLDTKAIFADIKYNKKTIRVYCIHLAAVKIQKREKGNILKGDFDINNSSFIQNKLTAAFIYRSYQVSRIKRHIEKCPYPYIITGDFNDTPNSFAVNELSDGMKNAFIEKGSGFVTTYYSKFPKLQIDYILVSPQFNVLTYQAIDKKISDHKPVISDIELK